MDTIAISVSFSIDCYKSFDYYWIDSINFQQLQKAIVKNKLDLEFYKMQIRNYNEFRKWYYEHN